MTPPDIRARILADAEKCVRCGSCKAPCPTYALQPVEGLSARGRVVLVGALLKGEIKPSARLRQRLYSCLLCGMCEPRCPVGVDVTAAVYHGLYALAEGDRRRAMDRLMTRRAFGNPAKFFRSARRAVPVLRALGLVPFGFDGPGSAEEMAYTPENPVGRVALFAGCAARYMTPSIRRATLKVLAAMGYEVVSPDAEVCCGAPFMALGMHDRAVEMAKRNIQAYKVLKVDAILSPCPTCTLVIGRHYRRMIGRGLWNPVDLTAFVADNFHRLAPELVPEAPPSQPHAYHDPCHLAHGPGGEKGPRGLLKELGITLVGAEGGCCGLSQWRGSPKVSQALLGGRMSAYAEAGAIHTACPGCMLQLSRGGKPVSHIIQTLAARLP